MKNNGLMMQYFEWYLPADQTLWAKLEKEVNKLSRMGVTAVWLPPAYKGAMGAEDVGYAVYDTYDLGEFDQKGSVPTKYGTKEEYIHAISALKAKGIQVYADIVLNHRLGADETELVNAEEFNNNSRNQMVGDEKVICGWTKYNFPGRNGKYSDFTWNWTHFNGIDWNKDGLKNAIYKFCGKEWDPGVDCERGNYDYLMGADIDFDNTDVIDELYQWGEWYVNETGVDGFRLDAVKHISYHFYKEWLPKINEVTGKDIFSVGEYWHWDVNKLNKYIENTKGAMSLFDVPLHFRFHDASKAHGEFDMSRLLEGTLVKTNPLKAVTFVDNHDTQPGQALVSWVEDWFKPHAYSVIMLRRDGYPCVFYGDYYGIPHDNIKGYKKDLDLFMKLRKKYAYGIEHDYFDDTSVIGWTREGDEEHKDSGLAVVMSDSTGGTKKMYIGRQFAGMHFVDAFGNAKYNIKIDENGMGDFYCNRTSVSVWIKKDCK